MKRMAIKEMVRIKKHNEKLTISSLWANSEKKNPQIAPGTLLIYFFGILLCILLPVPEVPYILLIYCKRLLSSCRPIP